MSTSPARQNSDSPSFGEGKAPGSKPKWMEYAEWLCTFSILFTGYLWYASPVKTAAQFYFRVGICTAGVLGHVVLQVWKRRRPSGTPSM